MSVCCTNTEDCSADEHGPDTCPGALVGNYVAPVYMHRYDDCEFIKEGDETHVTDDDTRRVTCPDCRAYLGYGPIEEPVEEPVDEPWPWLDLFERLVKAERELEQMAFDSRDLNEFDSSRRPRPMVSLSPSTTCGGTDDDPLDNPRPERYGVSMTTTKTRPITKAEVRKTLKRIAAENPDTVNPTDGGSCLYHRGRGNNIRRCIIGEMGWRLGLPTPKADAGGVYYVVDDDGVWGGRFTIAAEKYMSEVQFRADGDHRSNFVPIPWGQVKL